MFEHRHVIDIRHTLAGEVWTDGALVAVGDRQASRGLE